MPASDIPGYVQGFRFSDASTAFYDSGTKTFHDQAGYGSLNALTITTGTPSFQTVGSGSEKGIFLDNSVQGGFIPAIPWEGAVILAVKVTMSTSATNTIYPMIFGSAASVTSNGRLAIQYGSPNRNFDWVTAAAANQSRYTQANDNFVALAYAKQQSTRKGYVKKAGVARAETAAVADTNNGNGLAMSMGQLDPYTAFRARFGNLSGTLADTVATASTLIFCEAHFFLGNPLVDNATEVEAFLTELGTKYA